MKPTAVTARKEISGIANIIFYWIIWLYLSMNDLIWMGSARQTILRFPAVARKLTGYELYLIQQGMEPTDWKPMPAIGMGVKELRVQAIGQFRIIYIAAFEEGIYVLHAFQKKTRKTSKKDIDLAKLRLRDVMKQRIKK